MDNRRFDSLTKALAEGASRRSVIKALLGGAGALAGAAVAKQSASAQCTNPLDICTTAANGTCCGSSGGICHNGYCCFAEQICGDICCTSIPDCEECVSGTCSQINQGGSCNGGLGVCDGPYCVDPPVTTTTTPDPCPSDFYCGDECCPTQADYTCCGGSACCPNDRCNNSTSTCCPEGQFPCGESCCDNALNCCGGVCCPGSRCNQSVEPDVCCAEGSFPCGSGDNTCCDNADNCCGGVCCPGDRCNQSVDPDVCCQEGEFACGTSEGNVCCDSATESCTAEGLCCPSFEGNSCSAASGTIPDGCPCGIGATCHEGYCCFDWQICGDTCCDGDEECVACINGACTLIDQMESCNGGDGVCCDQYCLTLEECCPDYEGNSCSATGTGTIRDGCPCGDGATCHEGYCCFDWQICGDTCCDGDEECVACINGACTLINQQGSCNDGVGVCCRQYCSYIDECCPVEGCPDCQTCFNGLCLQDCEPEDACTTYTCVNGTCVYDGCEINETCCENGAVHCADLLFSHENCGACGYGCDGCEICFNGQCVETDACCQTYGDPCEPYGDDDDDDDDDWRSNCCEGLVCCHYDESVVRPSGGATMYCAQCCDDGDCDNGKCCHGQCIRSEACCSDADCGECEECLYMNGYGYDACVQMGSLFGEYCHQEGDDDDDDDYSYSDCCDGLVCCGVDHDGNRCFECCDDWDCPKGTECREGVCQAECSHDKDCPDGTCCCKSGHCSKHCCGHAHTDGGTYVDTLPSTGSGDAAANAGWMGAAALGAAAYFAGKTLRDGKSAEPEAETNE